MLLHLGASYEIADRQLSDMYTQHIHIALRLLRASAVLRGNASCWREMRRAKFARRCAWFMKGAGFIAEALRICCSRVCCQLLRLKVPVPASAVTTHPKLWMVAQGAQ